MRLPSVVARLPLQRMSRAHASTAAALKRRASSDLGSSEPASKRVASSPAALHTGTFGFKKDPVAFALSGGNSQSKQSRRDKPHAKKVSDFGFTDQPRPANTRTSNGPKYNPPKLANLSSPQSRQSPHSRQSSSVEALPGPIYDHAHVYATYAANAVNQPDAQHTQTPRNTINNWAGKFGIAVEPQLIEGVIGKKRLFRATVEINLDHLNITMTGIGDARSQREATNIALLSLVYQLHNNGMLYATTSTMSATVVISDQTTITYADANEFLDFYCAKFRFSNPVVTTELRSASTSIWDSFMAIEGRRVGMGSAKSKKISQQKCTLDVVRYLEQCDPALWKEFVQKRQIGEGLGDAPPIPFFIPSSICQDVRDLCVDLHHSQLYTANAATTLLPPTPTMPQPTSEYFNPTQKSQLLLDRLQAYLEDPRMKTMRTTRMDLPVNARRQDILDLIAKNDVSVFMAATGSGKTTQIPQMILDAWTEEGKGALCNIVCTQPRRLAALGVATRVAAERGEQVGQSVGYAVRFDSRPPQAHGSITFLTIGVFLKQLQSAFVDPRGPVSLDHITHILVDEVHERDVETDVLLVVLKRFLADRKARRVPIKIVLMSATIDPTLFQNYFPDNGQPAPVAEIPGRSFPVDKVFLESIIPSISKTADNWALRDPTTQRFLLSEQQQAATSVASTESEIPFHLIAATISHVLNTSDDGHVLVFLPGWEEINKVDKLLKGSQWTVNFNNSSLYEVHILHSTVPLEAQQAVFSPPTPGVRRIILTTNIAETSVTIPDVVYVVDSARLKENRFDPNRHLTSLVTAWVGRSNLNQRAGRAGRHRHGFYYGILSEARADALSVYQTVEMARTDLTNVVMRVKAMNFTDMSVHDVLGACIEPPEPSRIVAAINHLSASGVLDDKENFTALGRILLQLPLDVHLGRLVLYGAFFRCLDQAVTLAAIMANRDPWLSPPQRRKEARLAKESWAPPHYQSDPIATLRAFNQWNEQYNTTRRYNEGSAFLMNNFLSRMTFLTIDKTRNQILRSLGDAGILNLAPGSQSESGVYIPSELNANAGSYPALMSLIAVASMPKFGVNIGGLLYRTKQDKKAIIHRSSVNGEKRTIFSIVLSFLEKRNNIADGSHASQTSLCNTTCLDVLTYVLFGSHKQEIGDTVVRCDDWLVLTRYDRNNEAVDILRLRQYLDRAMLRFFAGLALGGRRRPLRQADEREALDDPGVVQPLNRTELRELSLLSRDVVRILDKYNQEKISYDERTVRL